MPFCRINSRQQMCDLHNKKIIIRWFAYVTNITEISVLNIGSSRLRGLAAALMLPAAKTLCLRTVYNYRVQI